MIHECLSNGCKFDDESKVDFIVCPVCGYDMDGTVKVPVSGVEPPFVEPPWDLALISELTDPNCGHFED